MKTKREVPMWSMSSHGYCEEDQAKIRSCAARVASITLERYTALRNREYEALSKSLGFKPKWDHFVEYVGIEVKTAVQADSDNTTKQARSKQ